MVREKIKEIVSRMQKGKLYKIDKKFYMFRDEEDAFLVNKNGRFFTEKDGEVHLSYKQYKGSIEKLVDYFYNEYSYIKKGLLKK